MLIGRETNFYITPELGQNWDSLSPIVLVPFPAPDQVPFPSSEMCPLGAKNPLLQPS